MEPNIPHPETGTSPIDNATWLNSRMKLRAELGHRVSQQHGRSVVVIEDPVRGKFYQVGEREFALIQQLDGTKTVAQAVEETNQWLDNDPITESNAGEIAAWLIQCNLAQCPQIDSLQRLEKQATAIQSQKRMGWFNPISIKFKLFDPTAVLDRTVGCANWIFTKSFFFLWCILGIIGVYSLLSNWENLSSSSVGILSEGRWIWLLLIWIALKAVHEWAHGIACRHYGGNVPEAGLLLLLFTPMPFVNVTSSWRFPNRWNRFVVAAAGMYVELSISFIAMIIWANTDQPWLADLCFNIFFLSSVTTVLFNANPLMRFDGYYMLSDALNIPNLYTKGMKWFGDRLKSLLFGTPKTKGICPHEEKAIVRIYGLCAFGWKILISFSLLVAASVLFYGLGLVLAVIGAVLWLGLPVFRFFHSTFCAQSPTYQRHRVAISGMAIALGGLALFTVLHGPATKSAPAIVQFQNEEILRANGDGFLNSILVSDGQRVHKGDVLLELRNDELQTEIENLRRKIREAEIKSRIHTRKSELAKAQSVNHQRVSLEKQLTEKQDQLENLRVVAPFDGFVFQRNLNNRLGEFVEQGDQLLTLAQVSDRKIVVSIEQEDLESIRQDQNRRFRVIIPGQKTFQSSVSKINARASDQPSIPAFCASYGGPLAVEPVSEADQTDSERYRLLAPRFDIELNVNHEIGQNLNSGQTGRAFFATNRQSLGSYLFLKTQAWFRYQYRQALGLQ